MSITVESFNSILVCRLAWPSNRAFRPKGKLEKKQAASPFVLQPRKLLLFRKIKNLCMQAEEVRRKKLVLLFRKVKWR